MRVSLSSLIGRLLISVVVLIIIASANTASAFASTVSVMNDTCMIGPFVLNTLAYYPTPFVDPNLTGNTCGTLSYDFDSYDWCDPTATPIIVQLSGPGETDSITGVWTWSNIPISAAEQSFEVAVRAGHVGPPVNMTVTVHQAAVHINPGYSVITLKTGQSFGGQIAVEPDGCSGLTWGFHQFAGDPSGVFSVDQSGVTNFSATVSGLYTYMVTVSNGIVLDSCDPSYIVHGGNCCVGETGNVNNVGVVDLSDLSLMVSYLTLPYVTLPCYDETNVNGVGVVDLSDLSILVSYLTGGGAVLPSCP